MAIPLKIPYNPSTVYTNGKGNMPDSELTFLGMANGQYIYSGPDGLYALNGNWNGDLASWQGAVTQSKFDNSEIRALAAQNPTPTQPGGGNLTTGGDKVTNSLEGGSSPPSSSGNAPKLPEGAVGWYNDPSSPYHGQPIYPQNAPDSQGRTGYVINGFGAAGVNYGTLLIGRGDAPPPMSTTPPQYANDFGGSYKGPTGTGQVYTGSGTPPAGTGGSGGTPAAGGGSGATTPNTSATDAEFQAWLKTQNLTPDQQAAIISIYNTVVTQDAARAEQLVAGMKAATEFSDPYFKAQIRLATDALDRGMQKIEGDLSYNENRLSTLLADLKRDIENAGDYLDFQQIKQMKDLERRLGRDLDTTRQDMAARGFGSSSIRAKEETYINDVYGDMRESTNRAFLEQRTKLSDTLARGERDNAAEVARLRQLAEQGKLDLVRAAESELGTKNLPGTYGDYALGDVNGNIERARAQDALSFANSFVF